MKKPLIVLLCMILLFSASCGNTDIIEENPDLSSYPIDTDIELTYWCLLNQNTAATTPNLGDTAFGKALYKATGIKVIYQHPVSGQESEAFSLMIASNELPDIIQTNWVIAMGGPSGFINDGTIMPLNRLIDEYAPNLRAYLDSHPDVDKTVKTDDGSYYAFPFIRGDDSLLLSAGPIVRSDWLRELGMALPKTVADWEVMLTRFKNEKGARAPFSTVSNQNHILFTVVGAYYDGFYMDDGKIRFSPREPEFKEAVTTLARWYKKGLLDKNYNSNNMTILDSNILTGKTGAFLGSGGSALGKYLDAAKSTGKSFDLAGVSYPLMPNGEQNSFASASYPYTQTGSAAISAMCKYPELAAKFLDYGYSEAGHLLFNFGIEGVSYKMENAYPKYTDEILNNPEGLPVNWAMGKYMLSHNGGPFVQDKRYLEQYYARPQQKEALQNWLTCYNSSIKHRLPSTTLTPEENYEYTNIMSEVYSLRDEMAASFIMGIIPLSMYDSYLEKLDSLGIDRATELEQAAYDRFMDR